MTIPPYFESWQDKAAWAHAKRVASLAKVKPKLVGVPEANDMPQYSRDLPRNVLTSRELEITEDYGIVKLLDLLRSRQVSVEEVTKAFLRRAALAHDATNCLIELLWDQAIDRARYLDALPKPQGALFGLPISTKEHLGMVGDNVESTASFAAWVGKAHGSNLLFDTLWDEGCVFYARTSQPQAIMHLETTSNVYGRTVNPYNRNLSPGGSTGGESALLGMRGSILGIGGDIGGSIRCPAAHVGVYGFKPTQKRISTLGLRAPMSGRETIGGCPGPMAVDREALEIFMKVALSARPWRIDPALTAKEWTPYSFTSPPKLAIQWWDGIVKPHPPMIRALQEVAEACRRAGMEVVDWHCEHLDHQKSWDIVSALYWPDGAKEVLGLIHESGEPVLPLTKWIAQEQPGVRELAQHELWKLCAERDAYRAMYARAWNATGKHGKEVDVILCPPSFGAATPHEQSRYWGYTSHWNLLDYPGVVFPATKVDPALDAVEVDYIPKNRHDAFVHKMYAPETFADAPVSLQIIGRRQEDEKVISALTEIERALGRP